MAEDTLAGGLPERVVEALRGATRPVCAYVYDPAVAVARIAALRAALPARVYYAVKANSRPELVGSVAAVADGLEVASGGELALAVAAGAREIVFSGPAKTDAELAAAVRAGATVHVESAHELRRLGTFGPARAAVRVNRPAVELPGTHRMAGGPTQFGVAEAALPELLAQRPSTVDIVGLHLHAVSNNLDAGAHAAFAREAAGWAVATAAAHGLTLRYLNLGGGLGVDYTGGREHAPVQRPAGEHTAGEHTAREHTAREHTARQFDPAVLAAGLRDAARVLPPGTVLAIEPGRYVAADAGWYAAEVLDLKQTHGRWFAVLRGGTHHFRLPAAWGYSHPFTVLPVAGWPYPFPRAELRRGTVDVAGELCTPRDVLARGVPVERLRVGDVLVFGRAGAYGWDISHHEFLRHPYPQMIFI
jgi:diaminopimelate decarboxylase